ncbi:hypothetical protein AWC38_SpisGene10038 [Stylophora pistillata]|uniref:Uncharacterized protein n=1 Tax=Stylophora pistillata TaxID=50429 RepID=A0A2B4S7M0_STYPI|nr:hypothetical protein AWC38_SpisGene10038 [Stylophora pistillata]
MKTSTFISTLCCFIILYSFIHVSDAFFKGHGRGNVGKRFLEQKRNMQNICQSVYELCATHQQTRDTQAENRKLKNRDPEFSRSSIMQF